MPLPPHFAVRHERMTPENDGAVWLDIGNLGFRLTIGQAHDLGRALEHESIRARGTDPITGLALEP